MIETDRLVAASSNDSEERLDHAIRPTCLADYIGQTAMREQMEIFIHAARQRGRRPAVEARMLYEESQASIDKRTEQRELKKMVQAGHTAPAKRPGKRDRRKIRVFTRKE